MSLFGDIFSGVTSFFGGGDALGKALTVGAELGSAVISANANKSAAKTIRAGTDAQTAEIRAGNTAAQEEFDRQRVLTEGSTDFLRSVVARDPFDLTPEQRTGLEEVQRQARNAPGFRGSARTQRALFKIADQDFRDNAVTRNIARSDKAATNLSNRGFRAGNASANANLNTSNRVARNIGVATEADADARTANANLTGAAMGTLASFIANDTKAYGLDPTRDPDRTETVA